MNRTADALTNVWFESSIDCLLKGSRDVVFNISFIIYNNKTQAKQSYWTVSSLTSFPIYLTNAYFHSKNGRLS